MINFSFVKKLRWWHYAVFPASIAFFPLTSTDWDLPEETLTTRVVAQQPLSQVTDSLTAAERPNIIILMADDLGKTDISWYGSPHLQTPNIDSIGRRGVTFTEGYVSSPICAPSRASLLTGRYQQRFGFEYQPHDRYPHNLLEYAVYQYFLDDDEWNVTPQFRFPNQDAIRRQGLPPGELTLAEALQQQGYYTGILGKWHLGEGKTSRPNARGFAYQFGFYEAFSLYYPDLSDTKIVNQQLTDFSDPYIWKKGRQGSCAIRRNDVVIADTAYLTDRIAQEASQFIRQHRDEPFFLYVPFSAPHTPFQAPKAYVDRFAAEPDPVKRIYYAMIAALDDGVGEIMATLREEGLSDNTIVWFLSDNGGATYTLATDNAPLKGGKFTHFEGGINVPFMVQWPGHLPAGVTYREPVMAFDIFTTTLAVTGTPVPKTNPLDGVNLLPFLQEDTTAVPHPTLYWRSDMAWAIRQGSWKLIGDDRSGARALYQLDTDKEERHNRYQGHPEVVANLLETYAQWNATLAKPRWPRVMDFRYATDAGTFWFPL